MRPQSDTLGIISYYFQFCNNYFFFFAFFESWAPGFSGARKISDLKIPGGIVEGDALHDLLQGSVVVGILAVFYPATDEIAQYPAEIVVPGVAEEGTGVRQHTDKVA